MVSGAEAVRGLVADKCVARPVWFSSVERALDGLLYIESWKPYRSFFLRILSSVEGSLRVSAALVDTSGHTKVFIKWLIF